MRLIGEELKKEYGTKVYKIALSGAVTCPNRDGTKGVGGCIFCSNAGSGDFAQSALLPIPEQLRQGRLLLQKKLKNTTVPRYIAYFQSFTSTYQPVAVLREQYEAAQSAEDVVILSVATRPDALEDDKIALLSELNRKKPVWVEFGLQTSNEETARRINRCYENRIFEEKVRQLKEAGIPVIAHLILGLPGETHEDELHSLLYVQSCGVAGVKLQLLHVLRGTALAAMPYTPLTMEEYTDRVVSLVRHASPELVFHRLTGDGNRRELIAPLWSLDKKRVWNTLNAKLASVRQGELFGLPKKI